MITVHHLNNSRSQRVLWLLEELGIEYQIRFYRRDPATLLAPPELRAIHPLGKSPVITDNDVTVAESGAIVEYLLDQYGEGYLRPAPGTAARRQFTYWLHYAEGSAMPLLLMSLVFGKMPEQPMPFFIRPIVRGIADKVRRVFLAPQLKTHMDFVESQLAATGWFAGDEFSAADIQMSFVLEAAAARGATQARPHIQHFLEAIHARPAYQRALDKGGPFAVTSLAAAKT
ncbi:glutathione S-transferase family protein [Silvimonas iriomotensis]|uniref:Glutathione S-transferase n=1 Tax=Silvimonas iriomotensis TaxID=449662 RepID=A0ABQ2PBM3_9NEIS|nr:glutathione S-transferase [Silvimonas iriomotensis]GGP22773.1 glutathione S-transferase [Silvimonas iriomotensis]